MKVFILALDGMSWPVFDNFANELPHLSTLKARGVWADLETVNPPVTAPAWVSFQTSREVGNHGFTSFEEYDQEFNCTLRDGQSLECITFYEILDRIGYNQLLVNLPYSNPPRISGDIVHSWLTYKPNPRDMVHPASLFDQLRSLQAFLSFNSYAPEHKPRFFKQTISYTKRQLDLLQEAMGKKSYDAVFCLNSATDGIQHAAFPDILHNKRRSRGWLAMRKVLKLIDDFIGSIFERGYDANFVVVSDHGFREMQGAFYVNQFLSQEGYLVYSSSGKSIDMAHQRKSLQSGRFVVMLQSSPRFFQAVRWIYSKLLKPWIRIDYREVIDREKTVAFMPSPAEMMIHLRFRNEGNQEQARTVATEIVGKINRLGLPVVAKLSTDVFQGQNALDAIPPIVLESEEVLIRKGIGPAFYCPDETHHWHSKHGIFLAYGPHFKEGFQLQNMHITDVIPTLFAALGVPSSETFDGQAIESALKNPRDEQRQVYQWEKLAQTKMDSREQTAVARRLKDLGYL